MAQDQSKQRKEETASSTPQEAARPSGAPHGPVPASPDPPYRRLRVYTFDPSLATQLETSLINQMVLRVPWEKLDRGPVGDYLAVIDTDPPSNCFYAPVDLNDPALLAQDGLAPSEGNPKFHQQMVYAVAMSTIQNFEQALGRRALWAPRFERDAKTREVTSSAPVHRLRIYPHALREANAYYSPDKKALLFGYFPSVLSNPVEGLPGGLVFTCLSHDVVAHETTHALLDGLHRYFAEPSNPDVLAFHEAFADVVALFQHFMQPEALRHQIAKTRGDLASQNLLGELAHQFGQAIGSRGALRDAIGRVNPVTGKWEPQVPDPELYPITTEPHDRGAILVAALFDAFLSIYRSRIADLLRIATGGTGVLPAGNLHPDLVNRLANEATKTAGHILHMAIRALDYCPPVDITFGEYLRALVTADWDVVPDDSLGYRIAVIEAFRRRGIYPRGVRTLAADALRWQRHERPSFYGLLRELLDSMLREEDWERRRLTLEWQATGRREDIGKLNEQYRFIAWNWIKRNLPADSEEARSLGLALGANAPSTIFRSRFDGLPTLEVHSVRTARRPVEGGSTKLDLVVELVQRRRGYVTHERQAEAEKEPADSQRFWKDLQADFKFRGGCTLLIDGETGDLRYCVLKSIRSEARLARQRAFASGRDPSLRATYSPADPRAAVREPFALLHRSR
ncbi:MAG: hypothetical protein ABUT39_26460 [Acidobacteriota bacterium]